MEGIEWDICDIAVSQSGDIVITGNAADQESHITVIDETGNVNRQWIMSNLSDTFIEPDRFCDFLSEDTIATTCDPNEIGIFNIRDGSYVKTNISELTSDWPEERGVTCIATDPASKQIIVGSKEGSLVCVFDDRLNLLRTLTLPEQMPGATDMFFSKENSVAVCCTKTAIVMTMNGPLCEKIFEFPQPFSGRGHWQPLNMCKDKTGCIYILWSSRGQSVIAKYGLDGCQVLAIKDVDDNTANITTAILGYREILLATTHPSRKMYQYDLVSRMVLFVCLPNGG
ncbi:hypothetical protein HOLleu_17162 [Holothuria leucospilota]|uniref:Uncharacterized protein n=1 Tax=Holothuria leucospilota TaxID=206669 RepID=A0A9Q1C7T3_HOLLE|nr:hypothetical protein HOLleu_17162 [Holothuria leucospilota]